jgi:hypothetical protein
MPLDLRSLSIKLPPPTEKLYHDLEFKFALKVKSSFGKIYFYSCFTHVHELLMQVTMLQSQEVENSPLMKSL